MNWVKATAMSKLEEKGSALFRQGQYQIAVFLVEGKIYAVDNRCPHEGYPLKEGTVDAESCVLTCQWHNWKFDLKSGQNMVGEDHVRSYPTRVEGGFLWLDLSEPSPEQIKAEVMKGFRTAFEKRQYGRLARELSRLVVHGIDPLTAIREAVDKSYNRFEYGLTHAYAATTDWLLLSQSFDDDPEPRIICYTEAADHIAHDILREPEYPFTDRSEPFSGPIFLDAIEAEDEDAAVALIRGAVAGGKTWSELEYWFARAALGHYYDFGHSLIYVDKVKPLLSFLGESYLERILLPLVRNMCYATREDMLPDFRAYAPSLENVCANFGSDDTLLSGESLFGQSVKGALDWVSERAQKSTPGAIYAALVEAASRNMLNYDETYQWAYDKPVKHNVSWLQFTHALTFGAAVRSQCEKYPALWPAGLLQLACFVGRNTPYLKRIENEDEWMVNDRNAFMQENFDHILDHGVGLPIISAHLLKTTMAVRGELDVVSDDGATYMLAALNRFLNSDLKQKHARRLVRQALSLVGRPTVKREPAMAV